MADQVAIVQGACYRGDLEYHWVVGVFSNPEDANNLVIKLNRLRDKFIAKPNDQYSKHPETWKPLDPIAYAHFVKDYYACEVCVVWDATIHGVK